MAVIKSRKDKPLITATKIESPTTRVVVDYDNMTCSVVKVRTLKEFLGAPGIPGPGSPEREFFNSLLEIGKRVDPVADFKHDVVVNKVVVAQVDPKLAVAIAEAMMPLKRGADGKLGVVAERREEVFMPLKRGADGKLGVMGESGSEIIYPKQK